MNAAWGGISEANEISMCLSVDERVLTPDGKVDVAKLAPIVFDPVNSVCHKLSEKVGNAFQNGLKLK